MLRVYVALTSLFRADVTTPKLAHQLALVWVEDMKTREQSDLPLSNYPVCCEVFPINNFQQQSYSYRCLEEKCETINSMPTYTHYNDLVGAVV